MCVIVVSKAGVDAPDEQKLKNMWDKNPHGAGILVDNGEKIKYTKGYMTWEDFKQGLEKYKSEFNLKDVVFATHFRITTHGKTDKFTTHPFLLSPRYEDLRKTEYEGKTPVMMHNGTITGFGGLLDKNSSDTQDYAATIGYSMLRKSKSGRKPNKAMQKAVEKTISSSRMVSFYGDKEPIFMGNWHEDGELMVSNKSYEPCTTKSLPCYPATTGYGSYSYNSQTDYGYYKDPSYIGTYMDWIRYTSKQRFQDATKQYNVKIKDGIKTLETYTKNIYRIDENQDTDKYGKTTTVYDMYTKDGEKLYDAYFGLYEDPDVIDLGIDDYIIGTDAIDIYQQVTLDKDGKYCNALGEQVYVDGANEIAYTDKALKEVYGKYWRLARQDLMLNEVETVDWTNPSQPEIEQFKKHLKWIYGGATNEINA